MLFGKHINRYYLKYSYILLVGLAALIFVDYIQLEVPKLYKLVINGMNNGSVMVDGSEVAFDMDFLLDYICRPMIFIIIGMVLGRFLWRICFFGSAIRLETDIRNRMFDRCKDLSHEYYQVNKVGTLMSYFINDLETVQDCFGSGVLMFFDALTLGGLALIKMWNMDRLLTVLSLIPLSIMFFCGGIVGRAMRMKWEKRQEAFSELSDFSQESFSGIAVIKAFVKETKELLAFRKINRKNEQVNVEYTKMSSLLNVMITLLVESIICVILGYGGYLVYNGSFDAGQLIEYTGYFSAIVWPVMAISQLIEMTSRGKASLNRISELLDAKVDVTDRPGVTDIENVKGKIEFRGLTFRYPDGESDVLKNISFTINAGESIGIVGKTGSGKSTLVDLILRIYNVPDGSLFIDDRDVNSVSIKSVRAACAYVPQDNFLFSDTIENNIAFAFDSVNDAEVEKAARLADVHGNIVEFNDGYKTMLGERGVTVSGGQKQRISIARALIKKAPILILDDSVSAVDTKTEKAILDNLGSERRGQTTILIAHRISTIERMDRIIYIDNGEITGIGTHTELYESCPAYRRTVDLQKLEDEGGENLNA